MPLKLKFAVVSYLVIALAIIPGCTGLNPRFEAPSVKVASLEMLESQGLSQRFKIGLLLTNPNAQPLPISGMSYTLSFNGFDLVTGVTNKVPSLPAYTETPLSVEATTDMFAALRFISSLAAEQQTEALRYEFAAKLDLDGWRPPVNIKRDGLIELR